MTPDEIHKKWHARNSISKTGLRGRSDFLCDKGEITASSLVKVGSEGSIRHPGTTDNLFGINDAGFVIHSAIHRARLDLMHCHYPSAAAVSAVKQGFLELAQTKGLLSIGTNKRVSSRISEKRRSSSYVIMESSRPENRSGRVVSHVPAAGCHRPAVSRLSR